MKPSPSLKSILAEIRGAEAACSVHGSPSGWRKESDLSDFHVLRQGFSPPNQEL
ncbi:MAG TPA: hypothetical protein PLA27_11540 [Anaerolineales bacterium]|nr:hypothetical protein [Anaerolineales bacterium]HQX17047.1 hypothetical protein [Anaerolineales bacterium]